MLTGPGLYLIKKNFIKLLILPAAMQTGIITKYGFKLPSIILFKQSLKSREIEKPYFVRNLITMLFPD